VISQSTRRDDAATNVGEQIGALHLSLICTYNTATFPTCYIDGLPNSLSLLSSKLTHVKSHETARSSQAVDLGSYYDQLEREHRTSRRLGVKYAYAGRISSSSFPLGSSKSRVGTAISLSSTRRDKTSQSSVIQTPHEMTRPHQSGFTGNPP
jgi:hypothetical protein